MVVNMTPWATVLYDDLLAPVKLPVKSHTSKLMSTSTQHKQEGQPLPPCWGGYPPPWSMRLARPHTACSRHLPCSPRPSSCRSRRHLSPSHWSPPLPRWQHLIRPLSRPALEKKVRLQVNRQIVLEYQTGWQTAVIQTIPRRVMVQVYDCRN